MRILFLEKGALQRVEMLADGGLTSAMEGSLDSKVSGRTEPIVCHPRDLKVRISWSPIPRLAPRTLKVSLEPRKFTLRKGGFTDNQHSLHRFWRTRTEVKI